MTADAARIARAGRALSDVSSQADEPSPARAARAGTGPAPAQAAPPPRRRAALDLLPARRLDYSRSGHTGGTRGARRGPGDLHRSLTSYCLYTGGHHRRSSPGHAGPGAPRVTRRLTVTPRSLTQSVTSSQSSSLSSGELGLSARRPGSSVTEPVTD